MNFTACLDIEAVKNDLFKADLGDIEAILEKHSENFDEDSFSLEDRLPLIDECFKVCISLKSQYAEWILDKIAKDIKETFAGFKIKLHEVRMNFV